MVGILSLLLIHNDMINGEYDCSDMVNMVKIPLSNKHLYICLHGIYLYIYIRMYNNYCINNNYG
jgi:hypothetical protein